MLHPDPGRGHARLGGLGGAGLLMFTALAPGKHGLVDAAV